MNESCCFIYSRINDSLDTGSGRMGANCCRFVSDWARRRSVERDNVLTSVKTPPVLLQDGDESSRLRRTCLWQMVCTCNSADASSHLSVWSRCIHGASRLWDTAPRFQRRFVTKNMLMCRLRRLEVWHFLLSCASLATWLHTHAHTHARKHAHTHQPAFPHTVYGWDWMRSSNSRCFMRHSTWTRLVTAECARQYFLDYFPYSADAGHMTWPLTFDPSLPSGGTDQRWNLSPVTVFTLSQIDSFPISDCFQLRGRPSVACSI